MLRRAPVRLQTAGRALIPKQVRAMLCVKSGRAEPPPEGGMGAHFRRTAGTHPLGIEKHGVKMDEVVSQGEWVNPTYNHVWSAAELDEKLSVQPRHVPENMGERFVNGLLKHVYTAFNAVTGYQAADPSADSVAFRLIFLESIAGVPGMIAAQHRHFSSLRTMQRDYGWIHTLLEEAENERMHLLTFMKTFPPGPATRAIVFGAQFGFAAVFASLYVLSPRLAHRTVGYIEEMAVMTYCNVIELMQTEGTQLNREWSGMSAPQIAKTYWRLGDDADMLDVIKQIAADETNHRDVNHTFASLATTDPNPYVAKHLNDAVEAHKYWHQAAKDGRGLDFAMKPLEKHPRASA